MFSPPIAQCQSYQTSCQNGKWCSSLVCVWVYVCVRWVQALLGDRFLSPTADCLSVPWAPAECMIFEALLYWPLFNDPPCLPLVSYSLSQSRHLLPFAWSTIFPISPVLVSAAVIRCVQCRHRSQMWLAVCLMQYVVWRVKKEKKPEAGCLVYRFIDLFGKPEFVGSVRSVWCCCWLQSHHFLLTPSELSVRMVMLHIGQIRAPCFSFFNFFSLERHSVAFCLYRHHPPRQEGSSSTSWRCTFCSGTLPYRVPSFCL